MKLNIDILAKVSVDLEGKKAYMKVDQSGFSIVSTYQDATYDKGFRLKAIYRDT